MPEVRHRAVRTLPGKAEIALIQRPGAPSRDQVEGRGSFSTDMHDVRVDTTSHTRAAA